MNIKLIMNVKLDEGAIMPNRAHPTDAGADLFSMVDGVVPARGMCAFDTGFHISIPKGYVGMVKSKSGLLFKHGIMSEGTIDSGYTGSIRVNLVNLSDTDYHVRAGDKISQLVILPIVYPYFVEVEDLEDTERGSGGFGSTGK